MPKTDMPPDTAQALQRYVELLLRWNRAINLISARDIPFVWKRHVLDSLQLGEMWRVRPEQGIDLGSGAGFPGLVLAIAYGVPFTLLELDQSKAAFLREAVRLTGAPATIVADRIEHAVVPRAALITARGLAPLRQLLDYAERLLRQDGECLFLKGRGVEAEVAAATLEWGMRIEQIPSRTASDGVVLRVSEIARR